MRVKLTPEAVRDKDNLEHDVWAEIKNVIGKIGPELSHEDLKLIDNPMLNRPIWQLSYEGAEKDYRIFLDVEDDILVVLAIFSFDFTHQGDVHWEELSNRD